MDQLVLYIAEKAGIRELRTSTRKMSMDINASQQTISRRLRELETDGLIYRSSTPGGVTVRLTNIAISLLQNAYNSLKNLFESSSQITGLVTPGMGEGGYYVKIYTKKFKEKLGFEPFPGTLNLEVPKEKMDELKLTAENVYIFGFIENGKNFGGVNCFPCKVNGLPGAIVIPDKTTHAENIMEVIAKEGLVEKFKLKVGDTVTVDVE